MSRKPSAVTLPDSLVALLENEAYQAQSAPARAILFQMLLISKRICDLRPINYSERDAAKDCHIDRKTARQAFDDLRSAGFIELDARGNHGQRFSTLWRLTMVDLPERRGTHDYLNVQAAVAVHDKKAIETRAYSRLQQISIS